MGNPIKGTNIFGAVVPFNTDDIYASHKAVYGHGGWRTATNLNDRNIISENRREDLMIVAIEDNSFNNSTSGVAFYLLDVNHNASTSSSLMDNNNWVLLNFGYGADGWVFPPPPQSVYAGNKGQRSFDETYLYICIENNLWKRVAIDWFIDNGTAGFSNGTAGLNFGDIPIWNNITNTWNYDLGIKNINVTDDYINIFYTNDYSTSFQINVPDATTSGNGLTTINGIIELGGILTKDTSIEGTNFKFIFDVNEFIVNSGTNSTIFKTNYIEKLRIDGNGVGINTQLNNTYFAYFKTDTLDNNRDYQLPNKSGTFSFLDDVDNALENKTTDDLTQGTSNKYYATSLFNTDLATKSTTNLAEGTNLYYTNTRTDGRITLQKGVAFGLATLDNSAKIPESQLPYSILGATIYQGTWNAQGNAPTLTSSVGTKGYYYIVTHAGNTNLNGVTDWNIGDWVIFNGSTWNKVDNTDAVVSVNGQTGIVNLTTSDVAEGSNLYYTQTRFNTAFTAKSTTNLAEGTNLYYTQARFDTAFTAKTTDNLTQGSTNKYYATSLFNTDLATKSTTNLAEGSNLYYTTARFTTDFSGKSTTNLAEGTNLYYTQTRFNTAFSAKSTTDLAEGTNLYYTQTRFNTAFSAKTTDNLTQGSTNKYYATSLFNTDLATKSTTNLAEGSNLYYTSARFTTDFSGKSTTNLSEGSNLYYTQIRFNTAFSAKSTTDLAEGTNLYYTQARFDSAFTAKSTTNLTEGTNLYYTQTRFNTAFTAKTTDNLTQGSTNKYYATSLFNTDLATKSTTNLAEGSNLYYTTARFTTDFSGKSTTNLAEGTNLYYTQTRFNTAFSAKSTTDLAEGTNLYYTQTRFNTAFSAKTTDNLTQGSTNKYYATSLFNTDLATKSTTNLAEGSNLYYTTARFDTRFSAKSTTDLAEGSNLYYTTARFDTRFASKTTDNLSQGSTNKYYSTTLFNSDFNSKTTTNLTEGTNQYFTNSRFNTRFNTKTTDDLVEGSTNKYYTNTRTINSVLTGYSTTTGVVLATDTIKEAIQKLDSGTPSDYSELYVLGEFNKNGSGANDDVYPIISQSDGKVIIGGRFTTYNDINGNHTVTCIARLNMDGTLDDTFTLEGTGIAENTYNSPYVGALAIQSDGKILVGGFFNSYNGNSIYGLLRLNIDGTLDTSFNSGGNGLKRNTNSGFTYGRCIVIQPDGKILVGGGFNKYNDVTVSANLIRLNSDGTLDSSFNSGGAGFYSNGFVEGIAVDENGKILVAGGLTTYNGASIPGLVRLNSNGTLDTSFNSGGAGVNSDAYDIVIDANNKILVAGAFGQYNVTSTKTVIRLNSDGTLDNTFNPDYNVGNYVEWITLQSDGKILIGGLNFYRVGSSSTENILRLNTDGSTDLTFNPTAIGFNTGDEVSAIVIKLDGSILVAHSTSNPTPQYNNTNITIGIVGLSKDGEIIVSSSLTIPNSSNRNFFLEANEEFEIFFTNPTEGGTYKLDITKTTADDITVTMPDENDYLLEGDEDSKFQFIITYDRFGDDLNYIIQQTLPNTVNTIFNYSELFVGFNTTGSGFNGDVYAIAVQTDGKIIVGGLFTQYNDVDVSKNLVRLNADGSLDDTFNNGGIGIDSGAVFALAIQSDGKIIVGGDFGSLYNDDLTVPVLLFRLNINGLPDDTFNVGGYGFDSGSVYAIAILDSGKILVGGTFASQYNGVDINNCLIRINSDGTWDDTFNNGGEGVQFSGTIGVFGIEILSSNKIIIVGRIYVYNGVTVPRKMIRLNEDGSWDSSFNSGGEGFDYYDGVIYTVKELSDGKLIVGGSWFTYNATTNSRNIARFNSDGSYDSTFNTGGAGTTNGYIPVRAIIILGDGKIIIAGVFTDYNGTSVGHIAKLNSNGTLDTTFNIDETGFNNNVYALAIQDGNILVGGVFTQYNGDVSNRILKLTTDGLLDNSVYLSADSKVIKNFYLNADTNVVLLINGAVEGGTYKLDITKTTSGNVTITMPDENEYILQGEDNSKFQYVITYDKFGDDLDYIIQQTFPLPSAIDSVLTGYSSTVGLVLPTDTIKEAIQKIEENSVPSIVTFFSSVTPVSNTTTSTEILYTTTMPTLQDLDSVRCIFGLQSSAGSFGFKRFQMRINNDEFVNIGALNSSDSSVKYEVEFIRVDASTLRVISSLMGITTLANVETSVLGSPSLDNPSTLTLQVETDTIGSLTVIYGNVILMKKP